jgi:hypothetical protein
MVRRFRDDFESLMYAEGDELGRIGAVVGAPETAGAMP